ncbi:MAG: hypothetical protein M1570_02345 [Chloroflexi bacterium]|nr:hypothetical protein [Chloroflexota bacterium]
MEQWVSSDEFSGQLNEIKAGGSPRSEDEHVEQFIRQSGFGLGAGTTYAARELLSHFYSEVYVELCKSPDGLGVVGARLASVDHKLDESDSKLDQILGHLADARAFRLTDRQLLVHRSLKTVSTELSDLYEGALRILGDESNPQHHALGAHSLREMMGRLPKFLDLPILAAAGRLGDRVNALEPLWSATEQSNCRQGNSWGGEIDGPIQKLLVALETFFKWWAESRPKRREVAGELFRSTDPYGASLPPTLQKRRADRWLQLNDYFVAIAHGGGVDGREFTLAVYDLEEVLLGSLYRRPSEDFSAIDALLAEENGNA